MKTFLELCQLRQSVRAYQDKTVPQETLDYVMECVRQAPSAVNFQPWRFLLCTSEADLQKLRTCYNRPWFETARHCFIACRLKSEEWVRKTDGKPHGDIDVSIAVEHLCLAAAEQGLGTCWVCAFDATLCKQLFNFPEDVEPVALIPIGYPEQPLELKDKSRKELSQIFELV